MLQSKRVVNEAIALCRREELRISENIQRWREILRSMRSPQEDLPKECVSVTEGAAMLTEEEEEEKEVELLQQALDRALLIRTTSGIRKGPAPVGPDSSQKGSNKARHKSHMTDQLSSKPTTMSQEDRNGGSRRNAVSVAAGDCKGAARRCMFAGKDRAVRSSAAAQTRVTVQRGTRQLRSSENTKRPISVPVLGNRCHKQRSPVTRELGTVAVSCQALTKDPTQVALNKGTVTGGNGLPSPKEDGGPFQFFPAWRAESAKWNRLWDKVLSKLSEAVAERRLFTERLQSMFHVMWPHGSPMDTRTKVDQLARFCRAMTHCYQNELQRARMGQLSEACWKRKYESILMLEGLEKLVVDLLRQVEQLKKESDAWNCLWPSAHCCLRRRWPWEDPFCLPLCPTLTYTSEAELKELEALRLRVALLEQEIQLHQQALNEDLRPYLTSMLSSKDCPSPAVLRSLYSLLGEGGLQFPAVVLDTEPD
ncbi:hypothetical protein GN956_G2926 [Arapaima gigas]